MLWNYLKIAWKVLLRRKFFTLLSLVGIGATLMSLLVAVALYTAAVGPRAPETYPDRLLCTGLMHLDTGGGMMLHMRSSYSLLNQAADPVRAQAPVAIAAAELLPVVGYVHGHKLALNLKAADAGFWQVLSFRFLEGGPYTARAAGGGRVAVISARTARAYFGAVRGVVGRPIEIDQKNYRVLGVVADVPAVRFHAYADVWAPYEPTSQEMQADNPFGQSEALVLLPSPAAGPAIGTAFARAVKAVPMAPGMHLEIPLDTFANSMAGHALAQYVWSDNPARLFWALCAGAVVLLLLLPALNLVTMNVSRMAERAAEIGIRKAFGATAGVLAGQFLVETLLLTLLGGVAGLALAAAVLRGLGRGYLAAYGPIGVDWSVFGWALLGSLVFGLLSGAYPAYRMAKLPAIKALKSAQA